MSKMLLFMILMATRLTAAEGPDLSGRFNQADALACSRAALASFAKQLDARFGAGGYALSAHASDEKDPSAALVVAQVNDAFTGPAFAAKPKLTAVVTVTTQEESAPGKAQVFYAVKIVVSDQGGRPLGVATHKLAKYIQK